MGERSNTRTNVTVCVRCRGLLPSEVLAGSVAAVRVSTTAKEVRIGPEKAWKFDDVFDETATQKMVYDTVVKDVVQGCFEGINATVLACT
jgi:kinesin family protein 4/21/27